jgi:hypothetical protein
MAVNPKSSAPGSAVLDAVKQAARQEQFLEVVSADEARRRFDACIDRSPLGGESLSLGVALSRVLAADVVAPVDAALRPLLKCCPVRQPQLRPAASSRVAPMRW